MPGTNNWTMDRNLATVIKKDRVRVSGTICLAPGGGRAPVGAAASAQADPHAISVPQEARVIESNSDYAIIEVICSCGDKMHIQCNYAAMTQQSPSADGAGQDNESPSDEPAAEKSE